MLPGQNPDNFAVLSGLLTSGNGNQIDCVFSHCFAEFLYAEDTCILFVREDAIHEVEKLSVRVGIGRGEVNSVKSLSKLVLK